MFFAKPESLGKQPMPYQRQADGGKYRQMMENATWNHEGVRFATVHVVGSNNGNQQKYPCAIAEFKPRDRANKAWIKEVTQTALDEEAEALVFAFQADPWHKAGANGFTRTLKALRKAAKAFKRPVLLINGDVCTYKVDRPFAGAKKHPLDNVQRLRVMGSPHLQAVKVIFDPANSQPFSFEILAP